MSERTLLENTSNYLMVRHSDNGIVLTGLALHLNVISLCVFSKEPINQSSNYFLIGKNFSVFSFKVISTFTFNSCPKNYFYESFMDINEQPLLDTVKKNILSYISEFPDYFYINKGCPITDFGLELLKRNTKQNNGKSVYNIKVSNRELKLETIGENFI